MREIKFRAWFNGKGKMVYNLGFDDRSFITLDDPTLEEDEMPSVWDKDCIVDDSYYEGAFSYELMQYTGLKDKNGKEIYEGDILRVTDEADEVNALNSDTGIGVVEWLDKWGFWNISNIENGLGDILCYGYVEIIGNIYEDKHLLEVEK